MTLIVSSVIMLLIFGGILLVERKCSQRSKAFLKKSDEMIADLASSVEQKYRAKFGKDPTGKISTISDSPQKKRAAKPA